jgi:hypothetical protein
MSKSFEERLERLENIVEAMRNSYPRRGPGRDDWRSTIGMFAGDSCAKEIIDEALKIREEDRRQAHQ